MTDDASMEQIDNILWHLKQAWYFALTAVNESVSQHGVSTAQIGILRQLANEPGLSGAELARRLLITPAGFAAGAEGAGTTRLGGAQTRPAARAHSQAFLTEKGKEVAVAVVSDAIAAHEAVFGVLTPAEQQTLRDLLARVVEKAPDTRCSTTTSGIDRAGTEVSIKWLILVTST